jgi:hypothetical protein
MLDAGGVTAKSCCKGGRGDPALAKGAGGSRAALMAMKSDARGA